MTAKILQFKPRAPKQVADFPLPSETMQDYYLPENPLSPFFGVPAPALELDIPAPDVDTSGSQKETETT